MIFVVLIFIFSCLNISFYPLHYLMVELNHYSTFVRKHSNNLKDYKNCAIELMPTIYLSHQKLSDAAIEV